MIRHYFLYKRCSTFLWEKNEQISRLEFFTKIIKKFNFKNFLSYFWVKTSKFRIKNISVQRSSQEIGNTQTFLELEEPWNVKMCNNINFEFFTKEFSLQQIETLYFEKIPSWDWADFEAFLFKNFTFHIAILIEWSLYSVNEELDYILWYLNWTKVVWVLWVQREAHGWVITGKVSDVPCVKVLLAARVDLNSWMYNAFGGK